MKKFLDLFFVLMLYFGGISYQYAYLMFICLDYEILYSGNYDCKKDYIILFIIFICILISRGFFWLARWEYKEYKKASNK